MFAACFAFAPIVNGQASTSEVIGGYTSGCMTNSKKLSQDGPGYHVMRLSRKRFYGHLELVSYIRKLAKTAENENLPKVLVGDMAVRTGGPIPYGHRSHQSGLDVDIWFLPMHPLGNNAPSKKTRDTLSADSVLNRNRTGLDKRKWNDHLRRLLLIASDDNRVDRIFVHPTIKRDMCQTTKGEDRKLLRKLRPWFGHHDHFHVRLKCPSGSNLCENQAPVPAGTGCDESLAWWFSEDFKKSQAEGSKNKKRKKTKAELFAELPKQCQKILKK